MALDYEYGINIGNRFIDLVGHDEDPAVFLASKIPVEDKPKKSKEPKQSTSATKKKSTNKSATQSTVAPTGKSAAGSIIKTNRENVTEKSTNQEQQPKNVVSDNNNQQIRPYNSRGGRGYSRRGDSAGHDRLTYDGSSRGNRQQRPPHNYTEDQQTSNETSGFQSTVETWESQPFNGYHNRGRGRRRFEGDRDGGRGRGHFDGDRDGGRGRGHFEGDRDGGRGREHFEGDREREHFEGDREREHFEVERDGGRGRGYFSGGRGRGYFNGGRGRGRGGRGHRGNQNFQEGSHEQQENTVPQQNIESDVDNTRVQSAPSASQEFDISGPAQETEFKSNDMRRGRGYYRPRIFRNHRNYGGDHQNQYEREGGDDNQDSYRQNRRQHDRQPRSFLSGVKPYEKRGGAGQYNWGEPTTYPEENHATEKTIEETQNQPETTTTPAPAASKAWAEQVDEAEKQLTLDEYKKQLEAKKQAQQEKVPQFNRRAANEGEDHKNWQRFKHVYRKKADNVESDEEEDASEHESEEDDEDQLTGKKKIITIPLQFYSRPIEFSHGSRGGQRRGSGRFRDRPSYRDDQQRSTSPNQQQQRRNFQPAGEYENDEQPARSFHGSRQGSYRGEYRRTFRNSTRGGFNRSNVASNTFDVANAEDFPTLAKK